MAVNVLFCKKKSQNIYTVRRSERNVTWKKQVNLLMIEDGEKRHYTAIKDISRLLKSLNATHKGACHFCMNCLNGFRTESAGISIMKIAVAMVTSRSRCQLKKKSG